VLDAQIVSWNRGDIEGFMAGYWKLAGLHLYRQQAGYPWLASHAGSLPAGFPGAQSITNGTLELLETQITALDKQAALVWGTYRVSTSTASTVRSVHSGHAQVPARLAHVYDALPASHWRTDSKTSRATIRPGVASQRYAASALFGPPTS